MFVCVLDNSYPILCVCVLEVSSTLLQYTIVVSQCVISEITPFSFTLPHISLRFPWGGAVRMIISRYEMEENSLKQGGTI